MELLDIYVLLSLCTVIAIILIATKLRKSHGMSSMRVLNLAILAGFVWPLLAIASFQAGGVLVLAKSIGRVRAQPKGRALSVGKVPATADS